MSSCRYRPVDISRQQRKAFTKELTNASSKMKAVYLMPRTHSISSSRATHMNIIRDHFEIPTLIAAIGAYRVQR